MVRVVSAINLKGGTGKTTATVALAEFLAEEDNKRVLVIDVDPQTNATVSLIDQNRWEQLNNAGKTLAQLFLDKLNGTNRFNVNESIVHDVSNVHNGIKGLDLLPSSLDLIDIQDRMPFIPLTSMWRDNPAFVLEEAMNPTLAEEGDSKYDYILIDCPPNLGLITQNALKISDKYLIPVIPDILSTLGIPQIVTRVRRLEKAWQKPIPCLGIVRSRVREIGLHRSRTEILEQRAAAGDYPPIWTAYVKEAVRSAEAMETELEPSTLRNKYGGGDYYKIYRDLADEFLRRCP